MGLCCWFSGPQSFACILKERERDLSVIPAGVMPSVRRSRTGPVTWCALTHGQDASVSTASKDKTTVQAQGTGSTHHTRIEEGKEGHGTGIEINVKMPIRTDHVKGNEATCEPGKMNSKMHQGKELYWRWRRAVLPRTLRGHRQAHGCNRAIMHWCGHKVIQSWHGWDICDDNCFEMAAKLASGHHSVARVASL